MPGRALGADAYDNDSAWADAGRRAAKRAAKPATAGGRSRTGTPSCAWRAPNGAGAGSRRVMRRSLGQQPEKWHDPVVIDLPRLVTDFATALREADARGPQAVSSTGRAYQPGIGPHTEQHTIQLIAEELVDLDPAYRGHSLDVPYPGASRQRWRRRTSTPTRGQPPHSGLESPRPTGHCDTRRSPRRRSCSHCRGDRRRTAAARSARQSTKRLPAPAETPPHQLASSARLVRRCTRP